MSTDSSDAAHDDENKNDDSSAAAAKEENDKMTLPLLTSVAPSELPMPGETSRLCVPFATLKRLQESYSRDVILLPRAWATSGRDIGVMVTILKVIQVMPSSSSPKDDNLILTECRCPCRMRIEIPTSDDIIPPVVNATRVHDDLLTADSLRAAVAEHEWAVWLNVLDVARLKRKLTPLYADTDREARVRAWAPKHYDRALTADEWRATPLTTQTAYARRAESFSFAVVRALTPDNDEDGDNGRGGSGEGGNGTGTQHDLLARAMDVTDTVQRLNIAQEAIERESTKIRVQLSIKNVIG